MKTSRLLKSVFIILCAFLTDTGINAQAFKSLDRAAHDIAYYRESMVSTPLVKVIYGRPLKNDQPVFGNLVAYDKLWRTGSNEATEIKFYDKTLFGNNEINAGTYVLYTIPGRTEWEIILSSKLDVLGAFQYDPTFDIARIKVSALKAEELEVFSIAFKEKNHTVYMVLAWDTTRVKIPLKFINKEAFAKI